jgi:hypothetical protein
MLQLILEILKLILELRSQKKQPRYNVVITVKININS